MYDGELSPNFINVLSSTKNTIYKKYLRSSKNSVGSVKQNAKQIALKDIKCNIIIS